MSGDDAFARHIIIDGLPKNVTPEKRALFQRHFTKRVTDILGHTHFTVQLVMDPQTGLVSGAFLSCATENEAESALSKLNMLHFTKTDVLKTYRWSALDNAKMGDEEYVPLVLPDNVDADEDFVHNMAEDENARPQFVTKGGLALDCEWYWFDWEHNQPVLYRRPNIRKDDPVGKWSEMDRRDSSLQSGLVSSLVYAVKPLPTWSTYGSMIISQHTDCLRVWGGRSMHLIFEVPENVEAFMVSPSEKYIVIKTSNNLSIFNIRTAKKIRTLGNLDLTSDDLWPIMRFSADDSLVAVCKTGFNPRDPTYVSDGKLYIYESETMRVIQGSDSAPAAHTFLVPGLYKAEWNPMVGTQIAQATSLGPNQGWKIIIANVVVGEENIASEEILMQRNFLQAERLDMLWHSAGTHLSVKVTLKKTIEYFLFHIGARSVAVIQLVIKPNHIAGRFAWQSGGDYFAVLLTKNLPNGGATHTLGDNSILQIYSLRNNKLKLLREVATSTTHLFWAPRGGRLVAVNFDKSIMHFITINDSGFVQDQKKLTNACATDCQWDPTGRFFATWVSTLRNTTMAPQYRIYDYNGNELFKKDTKPFSHFAWRPLPPSLLEENEVKNIADSLKNLVDEYDEAVDARREKELADLERKKKELENNYVKKMNDLARKMRDQELVEKRAELQASSQWNRLWGSRMKALSDEDRYIHEDVTEERIISRREVN